MGTSRLVLVGVGHAHLEVLRRIGAERPPELDLTVVSLHERHHYSGMVPGYLAGIYEEHELSFDLERQSAEAGGRFLRARAVDLDPAEREVLLEDGDRLSYDLVSFNLGSLARGQRRADVAEHAYSVKPMHRATELKRALAAASRPHPRRHVAVVGGGAAGVEVACAAAAVSRRRPASFRSILVEAGETILEGYDSKARELALETLETHGVEVLLGREVVEVGESAITLDDGRQMSAGLTIWLTGAAAPPLFERSELPVDDDGFLLVDDSLRSVGDTRVLGAGDCVTMERHPQTPKAGVYAVRQGPVLWRNLLAIHEGSESLPTYEPQEDFLSILNTCDGRAILSWRFIASHSRWAWWLKDWIDRRFVARYEQPQSEASACISHHGS